MWAASVLHECKMSKGKAALKSFALVVDQMKFKQKQLEPI